MNNKEIEEIEEMAIELIHGVGNWLNLGQAKSVVNLLLVSGWIKPDEDSVVLSREERQARDYECYNLGYEVGKKEGSKETAEKILDQIKFLVEERNGADLEDLSVDGTILEEILDELARQFGVEVKE